MAARLIVLLAAAGGAGTQLPRAMSQTGPDTNTAAAGVTTSTSESSRPNIVFFLIDDLGWADLGYSGSQWYETPSVDRLAREGLVFTDAYACGPNCAPSRASLMSGLYTPRHGIFTVGTSARGKDSTRRLIPVTNHTVLADEFVTVAEALQESGYVTASMGKWHLGEDPCTQGFDINIGGRGWGSPSGGGYHSPYRYPNLKQEEPGEYLTDRLTDEACRFIREHQDERFFLYLSHYAVHTPIQGRQDLVEKYRAKPTDGPQENAAYAAMVESVDHSVRDVLAVLDELDLADNTLVIFFSDNGGVDGITSNAPLRGAKGMLYEGGIRVPLIVRWPGVTRAGTTCDEPVIGIDFYPTLLEATGTELRDSVEPDGLSIVPLLSEPDRTLSRDSLFWHFPCYLEGSGDPHGGPFRTTPAGAIRAGQWKLIEWFESGRLELYDLASDIGESKNLANEQPDRTRVLQEKLQAWRKSVDAPVPTELNPAYRFRANPATEEPDPVNGGKRRNAKASRSGRPDARP